MRRRSFVVAALLLVASTACGSGGDSEGSTPPSTSLDGLSDACQTAVDNTIAQLGDVLDGIERNDIERGDPLPDVGAPLAGGCSAPEAAEMWGELITAVWVDAEDGSDLRTSASVELVTHMCDLASTEPLRATAQLACGLADSLPVEPWFSPEPE